ncbi:MAG TPA: radical SAM family heme chaperone HemW [Thermoanaerobaculia bacterium]|nr:radical SAM family heme chaperone HemW [Thermoanaerobaculia bacterium]
MLSGLYLHVPFCSAICPYCDFAVLTGGHEARARFADRLIAEAALWREDAPAFGPFDTVYFGGGTPTALTPDDLGRILEAVRADFGVSGISSGPGDAWIFLEANPEDVTPESLAAWRRLGVRTLSLGVQSFDAKALAFLGRRHGPEQARRSVLLAGESGFDTVSLDLIYGLPGETSEDWRRTLEQAVAVAPDHLSCYQLTIHEGTPFGFRKGRGQLAELPEPDQAERFLFTHTFLRDAGYPGYEVSNFARSPAHRSRHNQKYWYHVPYLGLGPSAHSYLGNRRWWNERKLKPYQAKVDAGERPVADGEELTREDMALEALMLGLRTADGLDLGRLRERYGVDLEARNPGLIDRLADEGLLLVVSGEGKERAVRPTLEGWAVADSLARSFEV